MFLPGPATVSQMLDIVFTFVYGDGVAKDKEKQMSFDDLPLFRSTDPQGSVNGAKHVKPRQGSQAMRLLAVYKELDYAEGLTDEMAAQAANLPHGWKRCSDLRRLGYIAATGEQVPTSSGVLAMVCRITQAGLEALK